MSTNIKWISNANNEQAYKSFFKKACNDNHQMLSRYLKPGMSVPVDMLSDIQTGGAQSKPQTIKNVTPTQQVVEMAHSELKREKMQQKENPIKKVTRRKKIHSTTKPAKVKTSKQRGKRSAERTALEESVKRKR